MTPNTAASTSSDRRAQVAAAVGLVVQIALYTVLVLLGHQWGRGPDVETVATATKWGLGAAIIWPMIAVLFPRAQLAALIGLVIHLAASTLVVTLALPWESDGIAAVARWMLGGVFIWPVIALIYGQRQRTAHERLESRELKRAQQAGGSTAIFDVEDEAYLVEKRRLNWMVKWLIPLGAVLLAGYHLLGSLFWWNWSLGASLDAEVWSPTTDRGQVMAILGGVGFVAFLFSRYAAGMGRRPSWRLLRGGASYLAGNALSCLIVLIGIALADTDLPNPEAIASYAIRIAMLLLGFEFVGNLVLDFYRPRTSGQLSRPAFDSRLLGLISEPGGIARSIADAINYQFGFEVSSTWFYHLLKRALMPMVAFALLVLLALSSVLIVDADEQVFVERFGQRLQPVDEPLSPGLHFKWPWPIDRAYRARVHQIRSLRVGTPAAEEEAVADGENGQAKPILWGEEHKFNTEMMLVVASEEMTNFQAGRVVDTPAATPQGGGKAVAVGLLMVSVDIQYAVRDLYAYLYNYVEPERVVEAVAYQVLSDYAAGVTVDQFLGPGRTEINHRLTDILQKRLDAHDLGIEIKFVGLQEAHPEADVAKSFQEVVKAQHEKDNMISNAKSMAAERLTTAAGSADRALALADAIGRLDELEQDDEASAAALEQARDRVEALLWGGPVAGIAPAGGEVAHMLANARAQSQSAVTEARYDAQLFSAELVAYQAAPRLYQVRKYLDMLKRAVQDIRKYVIVARPEKAVIIEFEREQEGTIDLGEPPK